MTLEWERGVLDWRARGGDSRLSSGHHGKVGEYPHVLDRNWRGQVDMPKQAKAAR